MADPEPAPVLPEDHAPAEGPVNEVVLERFLALASREVGSRDQFVDRLSGPQIGKLLDQADAADRRAHDREIASKRNAAINFRFAIGVGSTLLIALVWLFLYYGNAEQLREIIALLLGAGVDGAGGYGYGLHKGRDQG